MELDRFQTQYSGKDSKVMLKIVGGFDRYQLKLIIAMIFSILFLGLINSLIQFVFYEPSYLCLTDKG